MAEGVNSDEPQEPGAISFFIGREPIVVMTEETRNLFARADCGGGVAPCRATERFTELPMGQAALEFASIRHAGQYREVERAPFITDPAEMGELLHWPIPSTMSGMARSPVSSGGDRG